MKKLITVLYWFEKRCAGQLHTYYAGIFIIVTMLTGWMGAEILGMTMPWAQLFICIWCWFWTLRMKTLWGVFWKWRSSWHVFHHK
ncbi:hypothetical protein pEaSNUABM29_00234 [Erwinia phage pEa_SNUABM_29]|nr:hypothetical protein pEaSNUABM29_00234 [Erwinia phage pEa_SNUABM_29]